MPIMHHSSDIAGGLVATSGPTTSAIHGDPPPSSPISQHASCATAAQQKTGQPLKKKRGRPRKYVQDATTTAVSLGLSSPMSSPSQNPDSSQTLTLKRGRGRPPGSGKKQQLAFYGEWISSSAGTGFTPHVVTVAVGEDIASKILSFSQQGPKVMSVFSASGAVSTVTLHHSSNSGPDSVTYEGRFEILYLSGTYNLNGEEGSQSRSNGLSICLSSPNGRVIGGRVSGVVIAATHVQIVIGSFLYGGAKTKNKIISNVPEQDKGNNVEKVTTDPSSIEERQSIQVINPVVSGWSGSKPLDMRNFPTDIDLTRG